MRALVVALAIVLSLSLGSAEARNLASFGLPDAASAHTSIVEPVTVKGDQGGEVDLLTVAFPEYGIMVVTLPPDGTIILVIPNVARDGVWVDRGMCPRHGKYFPEGAVPVGDFVRWEDCLRPA